MTLLEKIMAGTGVLIALYLILTLPAGDTAAAGAAQNLYVGGVKALQGR